MMSHFSLSLLSIGVLGVTYLAKLELAPKWCLCEGCSRLKITMCVCVYVCV